MSQPVLEHRNSPVLSRLSSLVPEDHVHTWHIRPGSLLFRYYRWVFGVEACQRMTFCKVWWSVWFWPVMLVLGTRRHMERVRGEKPPRRKRELSPKQLAKREHDGHTWRDRDRMVQWASGAPVGDCVYCQKRVRRLAEAERFSAVISARADRISAFFQSHRWIGKGLVVLVLGSIFLVALGSALYGLVYVFYLWSRHFAYGVHVLIWLGVWAGSIVGGLAVAVGLIYLLVDDGAVYSKAQQRHLSRLEYSWDELAWPALRRVGHSAQYGGGFLAGGYHMIKYRTCPKVVVDSVDPMADRALERIRRQVISEYQDA